MGGGWHGELQSSSPSRIRQRQHPEVMGQELGIGEILPEAKIIWCK